jgi:ADP-ribosylation factor related protein 1
MTAIVFPQPNLATESVLSSPKILETPFLLLANKQDSDGALSVENIRFEYEAWWQNRIRTQNETSIRHARRDSVTDAVLSTSGSEALMRSASLDVMGISALEGYVSAFLRVFLSIRRLLELVYGRL